VRTAYRLLSTAVAVGAIFPFGMTSAHADTRPILVEQSAWFWAEQVGGEAAGGVGWPVGVPRPASGVPEGDLAVAYTGKTEVNAETKETESVPDKETYLRWDVYDVPEGSYVDSFVFTMFVDPAATTNTALPEVAVPGQPAKGGQPVVVACLPKSGFAEADGEPFLDKPQDNCSSQIVGAYDAVKKSYTFDASVIAQDWVDGLDNHGLAIRPMTDATDPFQLSFLPASKVTATLTYTPATPVAPVPTYEPAPFFPPVQPPVDTNTGTTVYTPGTAPQPAPVPQTAPKPVVKAPKPMVVRNVAASPLRSSRGLSGTFWFAMVGGVLLLGTMSLILGDPLEPVAGTRRVRTGGRHRLAVPAGAPVRSTRPIRPRTV
jgi:hypothetical protein